jgi:hypothetical protein
MIARNLWRVAGHAKRIAEDMIFWGRGHGGEELYAACGQRLDKLAIRRWNEYSLCHT